MLHLITSFIFMSISFAFRQLKLRLQTPTIAKENGSVKAAISVLLLQSACDKAHIQTDIKLKRCAIHLMLQFAQRNGMSQTGIEGGVTTSVRLPISALL